MNLIIKILSLLIGINLFLLFKTKRDLFDYYFYEVDKLWVLKGKI